MRTYDISRPPELINIGFDGENKWRPRGFNCTDWLQKHPDGIITLWIQPEGVKKAFPVSTTKTENIIVWYPLSEELYPGTGELQLTIQDGEYVGKSDTIKFEVNKSLVSGGAHPDSQPSWATKMVDDVTTQANRATEAADRAEQASGEEVISEAIESYFNKHPVVVEETDPTVPAWAKQPQKPSYTAQEVGALPDSYIPPITSVNGQTGTVVLDAADVGALSADTPIPSIPTKVSAFENDAGYLTQHQDISGKANAADVYTKTEVDQKLSGVMNYKGTKQTIYELPSSGNKKGDVWHIVTDGAEWAWNGEDWEELGTVIDLSSYATQQWIEDRGYLTEHQSLAAYRTATAQDTIDADQDAAIAAKYTKPSGGIPASDLAAGVIPTVPTKTSDLTNDSGFQTTPFEIPIDTDEQSNYTTTASAEEIFDNADNCIINFMGNHITPMTVAKYDQAVNIGFAYGIIQYGMLISQAILIDADKSNNSVNISVDYKTARLLPTVTTSDNGKFLRVVSGAWAAEIVPEAESNSFGGGS